MGACYLWLCYLGYGFWWGRLNKFGIHHLVVVFLSGPPCWQWFQTVLQLSYTGILWWVVTCKCGLWGLLWCTLHCSHLCMWGVAWLIPYWWVVESWLATDLVCFFLLLVCQLLGSGYCHQVFLGNVDWNSPGWYLAYDYRCPSQCLADLNHHLVEIIWNVVFVVWCFETLILPGPGSLWVVGSYVLLWTIVYS